MKTRAVSMVLLMIASALAGCTSGDPDGDGELGIDTDVLNQMIEDNLQDFINNSSVTVHQTVHYHNNTTFVDNSESSTNIGSSSVGNNGTSPSSIIQVMRVQQNWEGSVTDVGEIQFIEDGILQFPAIDFAPTMNYNLDGSTISMDFTCEEFVNAAQYMHYNPWYDWAREDLGLSSSASDDLAQNLQDDVNELWNEAEEYCNWGEYYYESFTEEVFRIVIPEGQAISILQGPMDAQFNWSLICDDGYSEGGYLYNMQPYLGGWTDCQLVGYHSWGINADWSWGYVSQASQGNVTPTHNSGIPDWYDNSYWYSWTGGDGSSSVDWIFYYSTYFVVPVE